jgi:hypothetical protein
MRAGACLDFSNERKLAGRLVVWRGMQVKVYPEAVKAVGNAPGAARTVRLGDGQNPTLPIATDVPKSFDSGTNKPGATVSSDNEIVTEGLEVEPFGALLSLVCPVVSHRLFIEFIRSKGAPCKHPLNSIQPLKKLL